MRNKKRISFSSKKEEIVDMGNYTISFGGVNGKYSTVDETEIKKIKKHLKKESATTDSGEEDNN